MEARPALKSPRELFDCDDVGYDRHILFSVLQGSNSSGSSWHPLIVIHFDIEWVIMRMTPLKRVHLRHHHSLADPFSIPRFH